jgi:hypothetical protein
VNKNQGWELIQQKYKANENTRKHNPKKKLKQTIKQKSDKDPMQSKHNPKKKQKRTINKKSSKDPTQRGLMIRK